MDLNEFIEKKKSGRKLESVLLEKLDEIATLKIKGFSDRSICEFLKGQGVSVSQPTLSAFVKQDKGGLDAMNKSVENLERLREFKERMTLLESNTKPLSTSTPSTSRRSTDTEKPSTSKSQLSKVTASGTSGAGGATTSEVEKGFADTNGSKPMVPTPKAAWGPAARDNEKSDLDLKMEQVLAGNTPSRPLSNLFNTKNEE
jgi:hypothetical protein